MKTKPKIEIDITKVEALAAQGLTQEEIADCLGIAERTLRNRKEENADFADAIKKGRAKGMAVVTNKLFEAAKKGAPWAVCFFLKTRGGWSEKVQVDNTSSDGSMGSKPPVKIVIGDMTPQEKSDMLAKLYHDEEREAAEKQG